MVSRALTGAPVYTVASYAGMGSAPAALRMARIRPAPGTDGRKDFPDTRIILRMLNPEVDAKETG